MPNKGIITKSVVSALDAEINKREIDQYLGDIHRDNAFNDILMIGDRKEPISQIYWRTRVANKRDFNFDTTGATVVGSGTNTITTSSAVLACINYTRINQYVYLNTTGKVGIIVSEPTITSGRVVIQIKIVNGTATHTAGEKFVLGAVGTGERGGATVPVEYGVTSYTNKYAMYTETVAITDVEKANEVEIDMPNGTKGYLQKHHIDTLDKFKNEINKSLILSDISDTSFDDSSPFLVDTNTAGGGGGGAMQSTRGLYWWAKTYGANPAAASLGTVTLADWDTFCDSLLAVRAERDLLAIGSMSTRRACDNFIQNLPSSGGLNSVRLNMAGRELDLTVDQFTRSGYRFKFLEMGLFNNDVVAGHVAAKNLYFLPENGRTMVQGGGMKPTMGLKYVKQHNKKGMGNEWILEVEDGALAPNPVGQTREYRSTFTSALGLDYKAPSQIVMAKIFA